VWQKLIVRVAKTHIKTMFRVAKTHICVAKTHISSSAALVLRHIQAWYKHLQIIKITKIDERDNFGGQVLFSLKFMKKITNKIAILSSLSLTRFNFKKIVLLN